MPSRQTRTQYFNRWWRTDRPCPKWLQHARSHRRNRANGGAIAIDAAGNPIGAYESYLDERVTVYRDARSNQEKQQARALSGIDPYVMPRILRWKDQDVSRADMAAKVTMLPSWVTWMLSDSSVSELCIDSTSVGLYGGANIKT